MSEQIIKRAEEIIARKSGGGNEGYCTLAQMDLDGFPTAATISVSRAEGIQQLFFGSGIASNWAKRAQNDNRASVCFNSEEYNITLVGTLSILTDQETKNKYWYEGLRSHFTGPEDPGFCVLCFTTQRYSLLVDWQSLRGTI